MGSKRPMHSLILEVLQAQPSLRDSKHYLNSFAPRPRNIHPAGGSAGHAVPPLPSALHPQRSQLAPDAPVAHRVTPESLRLPPIFSPPPPPKPPSDWHRSAPVHEPASPDVPPLAVPLAPEAAAPRPGDSHAFSHPDVAVRERPIPQRDVDTAALAPTRTITEAQAALAGYFDAVPIQSHTALVKVQGPFTPKQLDSIAEGMVYLKKLGLVSVIIVDSEETAWQDAAVGFDPHTGQPLVSASGQEDKDLAPWMGQGAQAPAKSPQLGTGQATLRRRMMQDVFRLSELLSQKGAEARPFPHALMRVDAAEARRQSEEHGSEVRRATKPSPSSSQPFSWAGQSHPFRRAASQNRQLAEAASTRSPLVSDDALASLRSALESDQIPVVAPLALYQDQEVDGAERTVCVHANDVLVSLAREMAAHGKRDEQAAQQSNASAAGTVDMTPLRLMVINREGGVPSHARGGNPHLAINLASEYKHIMSSFIWSRSHPTALPNLAMIQDCLRYMPATSSGVVVSHRSPRSLIGNLITNKAAHSPSLPHRLLAGRKDVRHTPTIIRPGLDVRVIYDFADVDRTKLTSLLEKSFRRKLKADEYYARLERSCDFVIVTGDYEGAAIVTREFAPGDAAAGIDEPIAYLDKFAVLPSLQGSGTVDFLWGALRDEVHGLGLLDALNDNGGKGGFGKGRDLVWKSRADNPVNRWYYERSNGFVRINTADPASTGEAGGEEAAHRPAWAMFWCDAEERLAQMAGERRLGATVTPEEVLDMMDEDASRAAHRLNNTADLDSDERGHDDAEGGPSGLAVGSGTKLPLPAALARDPSTGRLLSELDPRPGGVGEKLLPVVAPDEMGRLQRWQSCMRTIPSAWA